MEKSAMVRWGPAQYLGSHTYIQLDTAFQNTYHNIQGNKNNTQGSLDYILGN